MSNTYKVAHAPAIGPIPYTHKYHVLFKGDSIVAPSYLLQNTRLLNLKINDSRPNIVMQQINYSNHFFLNNHGLLMYILCSLFSLLAF